MELFSLRVGAKDYGTTIDPTVVSLLLPRPGRYRLQITITVTMAVGDILDGHRYYTRLRDPMGKILSPEVAEGRFDASRMPEAAQYTLPMITTFRLPFTTAGTYLIDVIMNGQLLRAVPIFIEFEGE